MNAVSRDWPLRGPRATSSFYSGRGDLTEPSGPSNMAAVPPGIRLLVSFSREQWYRALTFGLTFLLYTCFHLSRKPISIVKSELHKNCSSVSELATAMSAGGQLLHTDVGCSWKPFDKSNYKQLLGAMDYSFLCAYAVGMYLSGIIGERLPIRLYLTVGMLASGLFTCLFGLGYIYNIHSLSFYIFVQVMNGLVQTTGWPSVVTCIGNWFGKGRRGLIMGLWNSHTSVGNILGSLIAGYWVSSNWGLSFIVPGIIIAGMGVACFLFLIEHPNDLKRMYLQSSSADKKPEKRSWKGERGHSAGLQYKDSSKQSCDTELLLPRDAASVALQPVVVVRREAEPSPISFMGALRIPGVVEFSLCLLFAKLVSYTFLFWLPLYMTKAAHLDAKKAGDLSTLFDVGGIVGGILAGVFSDRSGKRASTCAVMLLLAAPVLYGFSRISRFGLGPTIGESRNFAVRGRSLMRLSRKLKVRTEKVNACVRRAFLNAPPGCSPPGSSPPGSSPPGSSPVIGRASRRPWLVGVVVAAVMVALL
ncbi:Glucose-6-phosphate exchanger SLC37A1 [Takifugu flavidus]|uniref:Glucose-6-phosphate exchanger SLC37A1 n=1 Tax=Takifugu flavidus TaxID=433684 RepID=A0A5C6PN41_9TELE|nr:Glucose-6-phosphate exchanger SLC37A1 [Takifugu flavidus]